MSLNNLRLVPADLGEREEARKAFEEAQAIRQRLHSDLAPKSRPD